MSDLQTQNNVEATEALGAGIHAYLRQEYYSAIACFERGAQLGSSYATFRLAHIYATCPDASLRDLEAARRICRAKELRKDHRALLLRAQIHTVNGNASRAIKLYLRAFACAPDNIRAHAMVDLLNLCITQHVIVSPEIARLIIFWVITYELPVNPLHMSILLLRSNYSVSFYVAREFPLTQLAAIARLRLSIL